MLNGLDLFSGIGGLSIALREWVKPVAYCEINAYCQAILLSRMSSGILRVAPIWNDIRTFEGRTFKDSIDLIYGGFPCQGISVAGLGKGLADERSGLFFEIVRLAKEIKPKFIFLENVPAISTRGGIRVAREVAEMGYDCRWCIISAAGVGALHRRERWFLLAHSAREPHKQDNSRTVSLGEGRKTRDQPERETSSMGSQGYWEKNQPPICGVDDAVPNRVDRIRALGNAVVPGQAQKAFKILMGITS